MRPPAEYVNAVFAAQVQAFASDLDQRARDRYPQVLADALAAHGVAHDEMSAREMAFADALLAGTLQIMGEVVGLAMRRTADLLVDALSQGHLAYPD